jgi:hypothetical protein
VGTRARLVSAVPSVTCCVSSRIHGTAKPWSVIHLAIKAKSALDWKLLEEIKEAFQKSELPFRGDEFWIGMKLRLRSGERLKGMVTNLCCEY